eukprot:2702446-Pyramimonas_sp.AAC.1
MSGSEGALALRVRRSYLGLGGPPGPGSPWSETSAPLPFYSACLMVARWLRSQATFTVDPHSQDEQLSKATLASLPRRPILFDPHWPTSFEKRDGGRLEGGTDHFSGDGIHALDRGPPPTQRRGGRAVAQGTVDDIDVDARYRRPREGAR